MDTLRKRVHFRGFDEYHDEDDESRPILDEQEQEALIESLRETNNTSAKQHLLALRIILALSLLLQLTSFSHNPLSVALPTPATGIRTSLPLSTWFTLLSIAIHINIALLVSLDQFKVQRGILPFFSYRISFAISTLAPSLSLFLGLAWQSTTWWCIPAVVIFIVNAIMTSIYQGNKNISELESMKYTAPGA